MACQHTSGVICQECCSAAALQQAANNSGSINGLWAMTQQSAITFPARKFRVTLANGDVAQHEAGAIGFEGGGLQLTDHPLQGNRVLIAFAPSVWVSVKEE